MLKLSSGIWKSDKPPGEMSGTFSIFGKRFSIFINPNNKKTGNQPDYYLTIQEYIDKKDNH